MPAKKVMARAARKPAKKAAGGSNFYKRAVKKKVPPKRRTGTGPSKSRREKDTFEKGLVFVAMSFAQPGIDDVFTAIKDTCRQLRLTAKRVDENLTSGFIVLEVVDLIERAEFIVFDLTHERPNVYYELGYAHGVGNSPSNIMLVAKKGTVLHFDIAGLRVLFYDSTEALRKIVKATLSAMLHVARS